VVPDTVVVEELTVDEVRTCLLALLAEYPDVQTCAYRTEFEEGYTYDCVEEYGEG